MYWLGLEDVVTVLQRDRLRWYGHVLRMTVSG